jgi:hypothetical protein
LKKTELILCPKDLEDAIAHPGPIKKNSGDGDGNGNGQKRIPTSVSHIWASKASSRMMTLLLPPPLRSKLP